MSIWKALGFVKESKAKQKTLVEEDYRVWFSVTIEGRESLGKIEGSAVVTSDSPKNAENHLKEAIKEKLSIKIPWKTEATTMRRGEKRVPNNE